MSLLNALFGSKQSGSDTIKLLDPTSYKNAVIGTHVQLVDIRTAQEYHSGHIDGAINIDFFLNNFEARCNKLKKDQPLYIYCRSGSRSRQASNRLAAMGFTEIFDLQGGLMAYNRS